MNITQKRYSLLQLWVESFKVVNRCTGKLFWIILVSIVLFALAGGILALMMGSSGVLALLQMGKTSQVVGIGAMLAYFVFSLGANVYGVLFFTVCCRLVANEALGEKQPLQATFSCSVLPTIYQIAAGLLFAIPMILLGIIAAILARLSPALSSILLVALFIVLAVRLCYSFIAIAVAGKGPIEGIVHSWNMTTGKKWVDALLMILMLSTNGAG